ncbi:MAG: sensor histidine kinase [Polyangiaceae bacterium]|nr:sensor histidine kinase [Polyangiaceae bacterium]
MELARVVAAAEQGIWTGTLPLILGPAGSPWAVVYKLAGNVLELVASEGMPLSIRGHLESFDVTRHSVFPAFRAIRSRRAVTDERLFSTVLDVRVIAQLETQGISTAACVPIVHGGQVFGVIVVGCPAREGLEPEALSFVETVAALIAPAVALSETGRAVPSARRSSNPPREESVAPASRKAADVSRAAIEAVQQCSAFLRRSAIDVRVSADEGCVAVGDGHDIGLAIAHLVTNAAEAAVERAPVSGAPSQPRRVRVSVSREGQNIAVGVDDSGRGVPHDLRGRVFEPGFSTKGKGRGNGLSAVRQIAMDMGGHVEIAASELGGALFRLVLPATGALPAPSSSGLWHTGATWPQMRATGHAGGEGSGESSEGEPPARSLRRASSSG